MHPLQSMNKYTFDTRFLSKTQLIMINQMQDVLTRRSLSTVYRIHTGYVVDKDLQVECPAFDISLSVVSCSRISYQCIINATMSLYNIKYNFNAIKIIIIKNYVHPTGCCVC